MMKMKDELACNCIVFNASAGLYNKAHLRNWGRTVVCHKWYHFYSYINVRTDASANEQSLPIPSPTEALRQGHSLSTSYCPWVRLTFSESIRHNGAAFWSLPNSIYSQESLCTQLFNFFCFESVRFQFRNSHGACQYQSSNRHSSSRSSGFEWVQFCGYGTLRLL